MLDGFQGHSAFKERNEQGLKKMGKPASILMKVSIVQNLKKSSLDLKKKSNP